MSENEVVTTDELLQALTLVKGRGGTVTAKESTNSYGDFLFVHAYENEKVYSWFGAGYHIHKEMYYTNEWHGYESNFFGTPADGLTIVDLIDMIRLADARANANSEMHVDSKSARAIKYNQLVDEIGDEDAVLSSIDDFDGEFGDNEMDVSISLTRACDATDVKFSFRHCGTALFNSFVSVAAEVGCSGIKCADCVIAGRKTYREEFLCNTLSQCKNENLDEY